MDLIRSATDQKGQKVVEFLEKNSREELTETADKKKNSESSPVQNRTSAQRMSARIELPDITIPYLIPGQEILLDDGKIHLKVVGWTVEEQKECSISGSEDQFSDTDKS